MNIQTPWVFYTSAMPTHPHQHHHHHPGANKAAAGLIPHMNCPPGASLMPTSPGLAGGPFGAYSPGPAHPSQLLLAAAAAAYGQQCAAASLLHQPQIPNGGYHLKVHKVVIIFIRLYLISLVFISLIIKLISELSRTNNTKSG